MWYMCECVVSECVMWVVWYVFGVCDMSECVVWWCVCGVCGQARVCVFEYLSVWCVCMVLCVSVRV